MPVDFVAFFKAALDADLSPYPYQTRLAENQWPEIMKIPTGLGKTASIIIGWLYKHARQLPGNPRRLIYCLPMRVLVEQTAANAEKWIQNLLKSRLLPETDIPSVHLMMGGDIQNVWEQNPESAAIIIGTQDQLLSRALNRGYAMSRFKWPVQFGLLNNDALWVMDEIQLMGEGLATTAQLQAFRESLGTALPVHSLWMSATLRPQWLATVDFAHRAEDLEEQALSEKDLSHPYAHRLMEAKKPLQKADFPADNPNKIAAALIKGHRKKSRTLVVVNTVARAQEIYRALQTKKPKAEIVLLHSRFRPGDRMAALKRLQAQPGESGTICIATQVVEAGVDISAALLVTDIAPWASLIQRFGRCNRYGEFSDAKILWMDLDLSKPKSLPPYTEPELRHAAAILEDLMDAGLSHLPDANTPLSIDNILRRKDLIDLFDTTPDLSGMDIDISRFIRATRNVDVQVFWRDFKDQPEENAPGPGRAELCPVSIGSLKKRKGLTAWRWDHLEKAWQRINLYGIAPGMVMMLKRSDGGYDGALGWTGKRSDVPETAETAGEPPEADGDDRYAASGWQSLAEHTDKVCDALSRMLESIELDLKWKKDLLLAGRWHDGGKAHFIFQDAMIGDEIGIDPAVIWAKTARSGARYARKGFRHELASALAMLRRNLPDLAVYLAACHHGKVRLSIRSLPHEKPPDFPDARFARGIHEGDILQESDLGGDVKLPLTALDLSYMEFGEGERGPSWLARTLALRDDPELGPFRLAFFEALLRAADWRASSAKEKSHA